MASVTLGSDPEPPSTLSGLCPLSVISRVSVRPRVPALSWTWVLTAVPLSSVHLLIPPRPEPKPPVMPLPQ